MTTTDLIRIARINVGRLMLAGSVFAGLIANPVSAIGQGARTEDRSTEKGSTADSMSVLQDLANAGNPAAQFRLGELYYHGKGIQEDEKLAVFWWKKAAAHGHAEAMFQLANAYLFGNQAAKFVPDPDREAAIWYFQAASAGHLEAQYSLGLLFLAGKGVVESRREAARWFRKASKLGHVEASKALQSLEKPGR